MRAISEHIQLSLVERLDDFDHWEIETSLRESIPTPIRHEFASLITEIR